MVKISVIMTVYNEKLEWINKSINSILNQTFRDLELIVIVDNPEYDEAINILDGYKKKDKRFRLYINERNMGLTNSLNKAISYCNGEYIARMDADDIALLDRLEIQNDYLDRNPDIVLIGGEVTVIDENDNKLYNTTHYAKNYNQAIQALKIRNVFWHPTWMFRRIILGAIKGYNNVPYAEDYDFLCRVVLKKYKICNISNICCYYRIRLNGITNSNIGAQKSIAQLIRKNYRKGLKNITDYNVITTIENNKKSNRGSLLYKKSIEYFRNNMLIKGIIYLILSVFNDFSIFSELIGTISLKMISKVKVKGVET